MKLSTTYKVQAGDTFATIARKQNGTEASANNIAQANPGLFEPLTPGISLIIPSEPNAPSDFPSFAASDNPDEVAIRIGQLRFRFWSRVSITRSIDSMDAVQFSAPFDPEQPGFKEMFRPFSFQLVEITVGGKPFFTGTMVGVTPELSRDQKTISVSAYSLPGALNDCTPPASAFPIEFNGLALPEISAALAAPFGISVTFPEESGTTFERVASDPGEKVLSFLAKLAKQRNLVISSTSNGELQFWRSVDAGNPVARLQQGQSPLLSVTPSFQQQQYYSHVTGIEPVKVGGEGSQFTVKNPFLPAATRPQVFSANDVEGGDVQTAVEARAARMFGNAVSYSVNVSTWRDPQGELWAPNTTVTLLAANAMVYTEYEFLIRSVQFERSANSESAALNLVLPESFNGKIPGALPWDG